MSDGATLLPFWYLNDTLIDVDKSLSDGTEAIVDGDNFILSNLSRVWNEGNIRCAVNDGSEIIQPMPFPTLTVNCK